MSAETATVTHMPTAATPFGAPMNARDEFDLALRKAKAYSAASLVPEHYRDNVANCLIALNMAHRINADELMVMQNLHVVNGKPGWSGKFLIATFNTCGRFSSMRFEWRGTSGAKDWGCRAYATELATKEKVVGAWIDWKMVEAEGWVDKKGSKWKTMPEQMFMYRAGAFLVNAYAPEIAMGLPTAEELRDITPDGEEKDVTPPRSSDAIAQINARIAGESAPTELPAAEKAVAPLFTVAEVRAKITAAVTQEQVNEARDLFASFPDNVAAELRTEADARAAELAQ